MTEVAATEAKKSRGEGLVKVTFADATKNDHKRVPTGVQTVLINGKSYALSAIPSAVKDQLVAFAFKARASTYVNNHADEAKGGSDVHELVDKVYADLVAGKLYAETAEGVKKEKAYDPTDWVEATRQARAIQNRNNPAIPLATQAQLDGLRTKMLGMSGKERTDFVNGKLKKDPLINAAYQAIQASKRVAAYNAQKEKDTSVMDELF